MNQRSRDWMLIAIAEVAAGQGTCQRLNVGAVISRNGRPITLGYNGAPSGVDHCRHLLNETDGCELAVHAEANAVAFAAKEGVRLNGAELHCTHEPCLKCAQLIVNAGIVRVVYVRRYRVHDGLELMNRAGLEVTCLPSR